ncbi:MAG: hypothetical protein JXR94_02195 [Candidatus Hydrogenedentes bacterium]|nr:hypothetical protein [Candidatus Hydrogenedentota bacterium]
MRADNLAREIGAELCSAGAGEMAEIERVYAGDRMSDLLHEVDDHTLLVTNLAHRVLIRPIELVDVAGICLLNGATADPELVAAAAEHGAVVMVSPDGMYETCGRLYAALEGRKAGESRR